MIGSRSLVYLNLFHESSIPDKVMIGKNFMFFPSYPVLTYDFTGKIKFPPDQIKAVCFNIMSKTIQLKQNGIKYFVVTVPSKQTIYNDYMPIYYLLRERDSTLLTQVTLALKGYKVDNYLNLTDTLSYFRHNNPGKQIYFSYDTHWNEYGAFIAYQAVMNYIYNHIDTSYGHPLKNNEVTIDTLSDNDGDLAKCLLVRNKYKRTIFSIKPVKKDNITMESFTSKHPGLIYIYHNPEGHGRLLMYRDSYTIQWAPFFAHHFKECIYIWDHNMSMNEILSYKPDIVIEQVGEMLITDLFLPLKP